MVSEDIFECEWGVLPLIEFCISNRSEIGKKYKSCLDIGSGHGEQSRLLRKAGIDVLSLDKYHKNADLNVDFIEYDFSSKFDIILCSHVIEHQRNVGLFLDKIFDIMHKESLLIIIAPKHEAEALIEGHLNCFYTTYFIQQLIHAGFDVKKGKYISVYGVENAAIVPKAKNFNLTERRSDGHIWDKKLQKRSPFQLKNSVIPNIQNLFHNCDVLESSDGKDLSINFPKSYKHFGIGIVNRSSNLRLMI